MNNHKRRFRPRQQKNSFRRRSNNSGVGNGHFQKSIGNNIFNRNGSMTNPVNIEKTIQKYQQMAKDALSSGDPVLSENYLQHADHFSRRLSELNFKPKESTVVKKETDEIDNSLTDQKSK